MLKEFHGGKKKKLKQIRLALTVCLFPAFLAYFLLPFPLWWETFTNDTTHVCLNSIILTFFWGDGLAYTYEDPKETPVNLRSSLALRCLTHCIGLVLCVPGTKQCIIWILLLPVSVCFEQGHVSSVKNRAGQFCALKDRAGRVAGSETKIDGFLGLLGSLTGQSAQKLWVRRLDWKGCCLWRRKS